MTQGGHIITLDQPIYGQREWTRAGDATLTATLPDGTAARLVRWGSEWMAQRQQRGVVTRQLTREASAALALALDLEVLVMEPLDLAETPAEAWAEVAALEAWALETPGVELRAFGPHHLGYAIGAAGRYCGVVYWRGGRWAGGGLSACAGGLLDLALALLRREPQDEEPSAVVIQHG